MRARTFLSGAVMALLLSTSTAWAAVPLSFTHHGFVWDGDKPADGQLLITVGLYNGETLIKELPKTVRAVNGFYNFTLDLSADESAAVRDAAGSLLLGITVGEDVLEPKIPINSVPFALAAGYADNAGSAADLQCEGCVTSTQLDSAIIASLAKADSALQGVADNAITSAKIKNGEVKDEDIAFNYAGSSSKGGKANSAATADKATSADLKISSTSTTAGDTIQIGSGTGVTIVNAKHAASADSATNATNANLKITNNTTAGDKIQIGSGTAVTITNAKYAASAGSASSIANNTVDSYKIQDGSILLADLHQDIQNMVVNAVQVSNLTSHAWAKGLLGALAFATIKVHCTNAAVNENSGGAYDCTKANVSLVAAMGVKKVTRTGAGVYLLTLEDVGQATTAVISPGWWFHDSVVITASGTTVTVGTSYLTRPRDPGPISDTNSWVGSTDSDSFIHVVVYGVPKGL